MHKDGARGSTDCGFQKAVVAALLVTANFACQRFLNTGLAKEERRQAARKRAVPRCSTWVWCTSSDVYRPHEHSRQFRCQGHHRLCRAGQRPGDEPHRLRPRHSLGKSRRPRRAGRPAVSGNAGVAPSRSFRGGCKTSENHRYVVLAAVVEGPVNQGLANLGNVSWAA
jgi:hypothetical protein